MPVTPRSKKITLLRPRRCKYCRATFIPERPQDKEAKFCCPNHRKAYWRFGGLPFDKMKEQIFKEVRKMMRAELPGLIEEIQPAFDSLLRRIASLESLCRNLPVPYREDLPRRPTEKA